jgi:hypothetical protein
VRPLTEAEVTRIAGAATNYVARGALYKSQLTRVD